MQTGSPAVAVKPKPQPLVVQAESRPLDHYPLYWAECYGIAPFLPTSRAEMDELGWDSCDIIIVTGDAYVDHPSFGMAIIGRLLEAQGFRVGIISQPDWQSAAAFSSLGKPNLFFGVTAGNMDSMINRYTADRKIRSDDAYSPDDIGGLRPDRCSIVYSQRCREAFIDVPIVLGGIEASLRRIAHYDYWQDKVRRSIISDAKADLLLFGNAERAIVEVAHRLASGSKVEALRDIRGTAYFVKDLPPDWTVIDSTNVDKPGRVEKHSNPYEYVDSDSDAQNANRSGSCDSSRTTAGNKAGSELSNGSTGQPVQFFTPEQRKQLKREERNRTVIRLPAFNVVANDPVLYAHANRVLHLETNPGNARALVQNQGGQKLWLNPPALPLSTEEMDYVFGRNFARVPHPKYGGARIPAYEMIRFSVNIMRGCFGGCTFCSITEHEGRVIQNRSEDSIINEIEEIRDKVPGFTGVISDLGGPTANMYRIACKSPEIEAACRRPSCVYPGICSNLNTDHSHTISLYRRARELPGVKKVLISSGLRYDLAVESPEYVEELVTHHVGGYLKIAPEHTEGKPLSKMMKPGIGSYDRFKELFEKYSKKAGKEQYLIPYFIAAHPGTTDEDMMNLALWLKRNGFRADQVQNFYPSPMATATAMYHSGKNPLQRVKRDSEDVPVAKTTTQRKLHKAFLRYHDPANWPMLREALKAMGREDLIGSGPDQLIPAYQPRDDSYKSPRRKNSNQQSERSSNQHASAKAGRTRNKKNTRNKPGPAKNQSLSEGQQRRKGKGNKAGKRTRDNDPQPGTIQTQHTGLPPRRMS